MECKGVNMKVISRILHNYHSFFDNWHFYCTTCFFRHLEKSPFDLFCTNNDAYTATENNIMLLLQLLLSYI